MTDVNAQRIILPVLSDDENNVLEHLLKKLKGFAEFNKTVDAFYSAEKNLEHVHGGIIPAQYFRLGLVLGWAQKGVDALARRCNLDSFISTGVDLGSLGYRELWDDNRLGSETDQGITSSLIHATAFVVASRGGEGEPAALIHFADASDATGDWNERARRLDNLLWVHDRDADKVTALTLYLPGRTVTAVLDDGEWSSEVSEHTFGVPAAPLAYKPRLKRPFGRSRISRPVRAIQQAAARSLVRLEGHQDLFANPEFWLLGADATVFEGADTQAAMQYALGRIKGIPDDVDLLNDQNPLARADVKQFPASSPEPHLAALNAYSKLIARELSLPDSSVAITDFSNPTSGESYDASQYELVSEAEGATDEYTPALNYVVRIALAMQNGESSVPGSYRDITAKWRDPRYQSRAAMADAGMKQIAALPELAQTSVGLELLGLDPQQAERVTAELRRARLTGALSGLRAVTLPEADAGPPEEV